MTSECRFAHLRIKHGTLTHMMKRLSSGIFTCVTTFLLCLLLSYSVQAQEIPTDAAAISAGEALFKANCKSCHKLDAKLVGPGLSGVTDRVPSVQWIINWVHNPAKVIASGDDYANKIYNEYNKSQMTAFTSLKDEQILSIVAYIKNPPAPPVVKNENPNPNPDQNASSGYLDAIVVGMIIILILLVVILVLIVNALRKFLDTKDLSEEDKEIVNSPITFSSVTSSAGFIFLVIFLFSTITFKTVIDGLYSIGVQKNYQPKQPIAFSHKIPRWPV